MVLPQSRPQRVIVRASKPGFRRALSFRLLDLNCLAPSLVDDRYQDHDAGIMDPDFREQEVLAEIRTKDPDVCTLQEVEPDQFDRYIQSLEPLTYTGCYRKHTGSREDGIMTIWKDGVFELVEEREISFAPAAESDANLRAQLVVLRLKETDESGQHPVIILVNCHLVFNFAKAGLKVAQISRLIAEIHRARLRLANKPTYTFTHRSCLRIDVYDPQTARLPAAILVGDFNVTPYSPIYSYLATGIPPPDFAKAAQNPLLIRLLSGQGLMFAHASNMACLRPSQRDTVCAAMQATPMFCPRGAERGCSARACFKAPNPSEVKYIRTWLSSICPRLDMVPFQQTITLFVPNKRSPTPLPEEDASESIADKATTTYVDKSADWIDVINEELRSAKLDLDSVTDAMTALSFFQSPLQLASTMRQPGNFSPTSDDEYIASEPWATVYQGIQRGTVDYVWVDDSQIRVIRHFNLPPESQCLRSGVVPNARWPLSDHFSLCVDLQLLEGEMLNTFVMLSLTENAQANETENVSGDVAAFLAEKRRAEYHEAIRQQREEFAK